MTTQETFSLRAQDAHVGDCIKRFGEGVVTFDRRSDHRTLAEKLWSRFERGPGGCWLWIGTIHQSGYGRIEVGRVAHYAHRLMYETTVARVPEGLHLDHLCRVRRCVNPAHLEPVTPLENIDRSPLIRKVVCPRGHLLEGDNVVSVAGTTLRRCRACKLLQGAAYREAHRAEINAKQNAAYAERRRRRT